ncbi:MAG TPA: hypothetical protein VEC96_15590, partial [Anaerolineae bacterium]|nr:hypothetical protein [Anaerolineae bacterium]
PTATEPTEPEPTATQPAAVEPTDERTTEPPVEATIEPTTEVTTTTDVAVSAEDLGPNASTTKSLSTNFTLLNFGTSTANVTADYRLDSGAAWPGVGGANTAFTIPGNGGQAIFRHYDTVQFAGMQSGKGSVVIQSDQQLGAVVQVQARPPQVATFGAYAGASLSSSKFFVPLVASKGSSASGAVNSQIVMQNAGSGAINIRVTIISSAGATALTKDFNNVPGNTSVYYDLADETGLPTGFFGSAVVESLTGGGKVVVVSNLFSGADGVQTFNAFPQESVGTNWVVPLFTARLANGLSAPIAVQNLSGGTLGVGAISLNCTAGAGSSTPNPISVSNTTAVVNNGSYAFNPVTDVVNFPTGWLGSCRVTATGNVVAFVQLRQVGTPNAGAYEAINASGTDKTVQVPLIAKQLANGFATVLTVQNLTGTAGTANFKYVKSDGTITNVNGVALPANGSIIHNHRVSSGSQAVTQIPAGWQGTVTVTSDQPIGAFVQLTVIGATIGDTFMAHNAFTQP